MLVVDIISRFVHIITAITLLGGSIFTLLILVPAIESADSEAKSKLMDAVRGKWKRFVHAGIALFLITGFYNYFKAIPSHKGDGLYHALVGTKIILALGLFFVASALVGRSAAFDGFRRDSNKWLKLICLIGIIIVGISSFVKIKGSKSEPLMITPTSIAPSTISSQLP